MARDQNGPLDGSTSGTIGGGGAATGGPTDRPVPPEQPEVNPDDAASGRLSEDPLAVTHQPDNLKPGRTDVTQH